MKMIYAIAAFIAVAILFGGVAAAQTVRHPRASAHFPKPPTPSTHAPKKAATFMNHHGYYPGFQRHGLNPHFYHHHWYRPAPRPYPHPYYINPYYYKPYPPNFFWYYNGSGIVIRIH